MEVSIHCPICKAHYDVDESVVGETVTCECGQDFIARAEDKFSKTIPLGYKQCPNCGEPVETAAILCVECGYNFNTGTTVAAPAADEEEENEVVAPRPNPFAKLGEKLKPLLKPLGIVVVIILAGWGAYMGYSSLTTKHFGISQNAPLGTLTKLDKYFGQVGLEKQGSPGELPKTFGTNGKLYRYYNRQLAQLSKGVLRGIVAVAVDSNGKVCGITASFTPSTSAVPAGIGNKVKNFIKLYWRETGCVKDPNKGKTVVHKGLVKSMTWRETVIDYDNGTITAQWRKTLASDNTPSDGENDVYVVRKPYKGSAIIGGRASGNDDDINQAIKKLLNSK